MIWHEAFEYFAVLTVLVAAVLAVTYWLWRRTRNLAFPLGMMALYFWSLHGAWTLIYDLWLGVETGRYHYLFGRMFPVELDRSYMATLALYGAFVLSVGLTCLVFARRRLDDDNDQRNDLQLQHWRLLVISTVALVGSFLIVRNQLLEVAIANQTGYSLTSGGRDAIPLFSLHQSLNRIMVMPLAVGVPLLFSRENGRYLVAHGGPGTRIFYGVLVACVLVYGFLLGNKAEAFAGLLTGTLIYLTNTPRARVGGLVAGGAVCFVAIALIDYVRSVPLGDLASGVVDQENMLRAPLEIFRSNEAFATHFSLYGIIDRDVPLIHGRGVVALLTAFVPRLMWPDRPPVTYAHYAESLGLPEDQGFTLHHAAGWYLNFGAAGVVIGGFILGLVWSTLHNRLHRRETAATFGLIGFAFVTGGLADFIRAGIASYKGLLIYNVLLPWFIVVLGSCRLLPGRTRGAKSVETP